MALEALVAAVVADHCLALRVEGAGDEHRRPPGQPGRHPQRVARCATPAVDGQADEIEVEQLPQLAGVLEPRLETAEVRGRGPPNGREPLVAGHYLVADGRDVVAVAASTEEAQGLLAGRVPPEELSQVTAQGRLRPELPGQVKRAAAAGAPAGTCSNSSSIVAAPVSASISCRNAAPELAM